MATKRIKNLVDEDMRKRELPTRPVVKKDNTLVPHTFMIPKSDLANLRDLAEHEGVSLNAAARMAIKRFLRGYR
jgi:hypothetical protein